VGAIEGGAPPPAVGSAGLTAPPAGSAAQGMLFQVHGTCHCLFLWLNEAYVIQEVVEFDI